MRAEQDFDSSLKTALHKACDGISASEALKCRIDRSIRDGQEDNSMKHMSVKKLCIGVAAACLLVSGGAVFAGGASYFVSSSGIEPEYTDYRDMDKVQKELGYAVDSVERFANGYTFDGVSVESMDSYTEETGKTYSVPTMDIRYRKDGNVIDLNANEKVDGVMTGTESKQPNATRTCGEITLRYDEYTNKIVPDSYELTEEDRINEQRDDYNIVYLSISVQEAPEEAGKVTVAVKGDQEQTGPDEVKKGSYVVSEDGSVAALVDQGFAGDESDMCYIQQTKVVSWEKDGITYRLSGTDPDMGAEAMLDMAEEILTAE